RAEELNWRQKGEERAERGAIRHSDDRRGGPADDRLRGGSSDRRGGPLAGPYGNVLLVGRGGLHVDDEVRAVEDVAKLVDEAVGEDCLADEGGPREADDQAPVGAAPHILL